MTERTPLTPAEPDAYPFPVRVNWAWQGGAITEAVVKGIVVFCGRESVTGAYATLCGDAWAQYQREETSAPDGQWPTIWGALPVREGRINAVWVPLDWLPAAATMQWPGRGSSGVSARNAQRGGMR